ncbi:hypothetical protein TNCV_4683181 [Trichonephila clavipes]|nr:hypothetical protein TNCV_4683181 [Trichonephila clavipes]
MFSNSTLESSSHSARPLSSFSFHKLLPYNLDQITAAHGSSIVTTEFSQSAALFLEELNPILTLKETCENHGRLVPGGKLWSTTTSRKLWSNHVRVSTDREEHRIPHMAEEYRNASTPEIVVFFGTRATP